jgi:acetyl esterase/lipase
LKVRVINGPGVAVDGELLQEWLAIWSRSLGLSSELVECLDHQALLRELERSADDNHAVLLNPGSLGGNSELVSGARGTGQPTVWVDVRDAMHHEPQVASSDTMRVRGRGIDGYRWALRRLAQYIASPPSVVAYGGSPDQVGDLRLPPGTGPHAVVLLIHGGSWQEAWERDTIEPLAIDLMHRGYATLNIEYRRVGPSKGGWPNTCTDIASAMRKLTSLSAEHRLDLERLVIVGHSAGGHLALWAAAQRGVTPDQRADVVPELVVSLAGIPDLIECSRRGLGDGGNIAASFMGARYDVDPEAYRLASPAESLPLGVSQLLVQGTGDAWADLVDLNRLYARSARAAGDRIELLELDGATHFDVIDPLSDAWHATVRRVVELVPPDPP